MMKWLHFNTYSFTKSIFEIFKENCGEYHRKHFSKLHKLDIVFHLPSTDTNIMKKTSASINPNGEIV